MAMLDADEERNQVQRIQQRFNIPELTGGGGVTDSKLKFNSATSAYLS
jgi:hypothetical protein